MSGEAHGAIGRGVNAALRPVYLHIFPTSCRDIGRAAARAPATGAPTFPPAASADANRRCIAAT